MSEGCLGVYHSSNAAEVVGETKTKVRALELPLYTAINEQLGRMWLSGANKNKFGGLFCL